MAARMQQRRGTAAQWTSANPVLGSGEIGFETDTSKFKIGNGTSTWSNLTYFANLNQILDGAPDLLNTLNEIAAAIGDDPNFITTIESSLDLKADITYVDSEIETLELVDDGILEGLSTTNGVVNTLGTSLDAVEESVGTIETAIGVMENSITTINEEIDGIDTLISGITTDISGISSDLETLDSLVDTKSPTASPTFTGDVVLPTTTSIGNVSANEISHLNGVTSALQTQIDAKLSSTSAASTYAPLNDPTFGGTVSLPSTTSVGDVSATEIGYLDGVTSSIQTQLTDLDTTKADIASPTFTGTVSGVTKTHVGLGNVDNTADADKPVSTATQTALDAKASLAGATFTGNVEVDGNLVVDGNLTVNGSEFLASSTSIVIEDNMLQLAHNQAGNTVDLGLVVAYNDGTYHHAGIVRDVSANTWKFFKDVETDPTTTVDFSEGTLDDLELNNVKAAGVVFTDGTQTKAGVPSLTTFVEKTASYTLDTLAHQDNIIEMNSTSPMTFTIPTNAALAWPIGASMDIFQTNTGEVTIAASAGVALNRTPGNKLRTQWSSATILKRGTDSWILYGDLKA
jgi:hypothetical protein